MPSSSRRSSGSSRAPLPRRRPGRWHQRARRGVARPPSRWPAPPGPGNCNERMLIDRRRRRRRQRSPLQGVPSRPASTACWSPSTARPSRRWIPATPTRTGTPLRTATSPVGQGPQRRRAPAARTRSCPTRARPTRTRLRDAGRRPRRRLADASARSTALEEVRHPHAGPAVLLRRRAVSVLRSIASGPHAGRRVPTLPAPDYRKRTAFVTGRSPSRLPPGLAPGRPPWLGRDRRATSTGPSTSTADGSESHARDQLLRPRRRHLAVRQGARRGRRRPHQLRRVARSQIRPLVLLLHDGEVLLPRLLRAPTSTTRTPTATACATARTTRTTTTSRTSWS